jgi:hypothetical protein
MPDLRFYAQEADGRDYPRPAVPPLARPAWREWFGGSRAAASAFLNGGESFMSGRYALAEAMRRAGAGSGRAVLLPSFHCRAMVEPVLFLGSEPRFYPLLSDLRPDFQALSGLMSGRAAPVAMVLTHYFGFPNLPAEAEAFCRHYGIALIEDCAHALYGEEKGRLLGSVGQFAVTSLWKFLAVRDGAVMIDRSEDTPRDPRARVWSDELKGLAWLMEHWIGRGGRSALPALKASELAAEADRIAARQGKAEPQQGLKEFSPASAGAGALRCSRWLAAASTHGRVAARRRAHYTAWLEGVQRLPGIRPLFAELPQGVVPYAFPLLLNEPEPVFRRLKTAGVPIWRWEDMAICDCATAERYRLRLLQLPCHQGLRQDELDWMIRAVRIAVEMGA